MAFLFYAGGEGAVFSCGHNRFPGGRVGFSKVKDFSIEKRGLRRKLLVIESLVFILPCITLSYVFHTGDFVFNVSQLIIFAFILILIVGGLLILRQIFRGFYLIEESMRRVVDGDTLLADVRLNTRELHGVNQAFNGLMKKFEGTAKELQKKSFDLCSINELNKTAFRLLDFDKLLGALLEKAMSVTCAKNGSIFLVEYEKKRFRIAVASGLSPGPSKDTCLPIDESLAKPVVDERRPLLVENIETDSRTLKPNNPKYGSPSFLSMPIFVRDKLVAVLNLSCKEAAPAFDEADEQILAIMIGGMGIALENAFLHFKVNAHLTQLKEQNLTLSYTNEYLKKEIMNRSRAEAALRESKQRYRLLFENANDAIFVIQDEKISFPNPKAIEISGKKAAEMNPATFIDCLDPKESIGINYRHRKCLNNEKVQKNYLFQLVSNKGEKRWMEHNIIRILWDGRPATLNFLTDISQQKELENQILQTQKMKAIGTLVGGIAHGFNNLFMGIQGNVSLMLLDVRSGSAFHERLKRIERLIDSGATLTKQLLGFARGGKYKAKRMDLNKTLKRTAQMLRNAETGIIVHEHYQDDLFSVIADQEQIEQVIVNVLDNAMKAMPNGGEVIIGTKNMEFDEKIADHLGIQIGRYAKVTIKDTGCGMSNSTKKRIFEPFFTTQHMGKGAGMGLASAFGIIENHGGSIQVESMISQGTTITLLLPAAEKATDIPVVAVEELPRGSETILFVNGEAVIQDVVKPMLEASGYRVLIADSGMAAIDLYEHKGEGIDLVVLDMMMKDMDGGEIYVRLKQLNSDLKAVFFSSFNGEEPDTVILDEEDRFIQKPFDMKKLSLKIRDVLDEQQA